MTADNQYLKKKWDETAAHEYSFGQGREKGNIEGKEEGIREVIVKLIKKDYDDDLIVDLLEIDLELVRTVRAEVGQKE